MQPLKITIEGDYFDSQIYSGLLYLWCIDGSIKTIDFNQLVFSLIEKKEDLFAYYCAFLDGRYLYKSGISNLLSDPEFKNLLLNKLKRINSHNLVIYKKDLEKHILGEQDLAGNIIHIDSEIYKNKIYISNDIGLFTFSIRSGTIYPVSTVGKKIWDTKILSIKANFYSQFALSAGSDGLYELNKSNLRYKNLKKVDSTSPIYEITTGHSNVANYNSLSLFNTSFIGESSLFLFGWTKKDETVENRHSGKILKKSISFNGFFNKKNKSISWGSDDKIYSIQGNTIHAYKYNTESESSEEDLEPFKKIGEKKLKKWPGEALFGSNSIFGVIVECDDSLLVLRSDDELILIDGPVTRWRTFPRSRNYENHLHVINDNSLEIYSFYHDFIKRQDEKLFGIDSGIYIHEGIDEDRFVAANNAFQANRNQQNTGGSMTKKRITSSFDEKGIESLAKDKPVVYEIQDKSGKNIYTGSAKRGRVEKRLKEHLPGGSDPIRGGDKVKISQKSSIEAAQKAEQRKIKKEKPPQNRRGK